MLLFQSIRALSSFWEFGEMVFLIPAALVIALLLQTVIFRNQRRPWLPIAVIVLSISHRREPFRPRPPRSDSVNSSAPRAMASSAM